MDVRPTRVTAGGSEEWISPAQILLCALVREEADKLPSRACEVAIVGAGPYGLSVAAYLRSYGIEPKLFGKPMEFWQQQMPRGMLLRSSKRASSIGAPNKSLRLDDYAAAAGIEISSRVRLEDFAAYGHWFQQKAIPAIDERKVSLMAVSTDGFCLTLADGELFRARRAVIATGIGSFAYRPPQFAKLPAALVSHSSDHSDFDKFAGARTAVIGAGQSAFESAALLLESGADVEIFVREAKVIWLTSHEVLQQAPYIKSLLYPLLYPPAEVGPIGFNQIIVRPRLFRILPRNWRDHVTYSGIRPMVSNWLRPRVARARIETSRSVCSAVPARHGIDLTLDNGTVRHFDHVVLGTGYRVDISRYRLIASDLRRSIRMAEGFPRLSLGFQSSVPGLFFVGASATGSFGPLVRFVAGTEYCARATAQSIVADIRSFS